MFDFNKFGKVINEAATVRSFDIEVSQFYGPTHEAFDLASLTMAESLQELTAVSLGAQEILVESAFINPDDYESINENIFKTVWEKVLGFFKKAKSLVLGLIDKMKASAAAMNGDTSKWLKIMKPRVEANMRFSSKFKYTGIPYTAVIETSKFGAQIATITTQCNAQLSVIEEQVKKVDAFQENLKAGRYSAAAISRLGTKTDLAGDVKFDIATKTQIEEFYKTIGYKDLEDIRKKTHDEIYGKSAQEIEIEGFSKGVKAADMLSAIEKASEFNDKLTEAYESINELLDKVISAISDVKDKSEGIELTFETDKGGKATDDEKTKISQIKSNISPFFSMMSTVYHEKQKALQTMSAVTKEIHKSQITSFMSTLSKLANHKENKK